MVQLRREEQLFLIEQLTLLLNAGVAIISAIRLLQRLTKRRGFRLFLENMEKEVQAGTPLSDLFTTIKGFPQLYIALMQVGESTGKLPLLLSHIVIIEKKRQEIVRSVKKATTYPLMILIVAALVLLFILIVVVPTFESLYNSSGAELPSLTQKIIAISQWLFSSSALLSLLSLFVISSLFVRFYHKSTFFHYQVDKLCLKLPLLRSIYVASFNARFSLVMAIMIRSGIPMIKGLTLFKAGINNRYLSYQIERLSQHINAGKPLSISGEELGIFSNVMLTLIAVGEMSGQLAQSLQQAGEYHQTIVESHINRFIALLDPIALLLVGTIVGVILIALYLPLFSMGMAIG